MGHVWGNTKGARYGPGDRSGSSPLTESIDHLRVAQTSRVYLQKPWVIPYLFVRLLRVLYINARLRPINPTIFLDAIHIELRREGKVENEDKRLVCATIIND